MKLSKILLSIATVSLIFTPFFTHPASAVETPIFKNQASVTETTTKVNKNLFQPQSETRIHLKVGEVRNLANAGNRVTFSPMGQNPPAITWRALGVDYKTIQVFAVAKGQAWIEFSDDSSSWRTRYYFVVQ